MKRKKIIRKAKKKYKLSARRLEKVIEHVYVMYIPHNCIHKYLIEQGLARKEPKKKEGVSFIRYEREILNVRWAI